MKTLKFVLVSALIAISTSAFAGNTENCTACEIQKANESTSLLKEDSAALADSNVKGMLQNMTQQVREKVNSDGVNMILQSMTKSLRERINGNTSNNF